MGQTGVESIIEQCSYCLENSGHMEGCPKTLLDEQTAVREFHAGESDGFLRKAPKSHHPSYQLGHEQSRLALLRFECDLFEDIF